MLNRGRVVGNDRVRLTEVAVGRDLQGEVAERRGDAERSQSARNRARVLPQRSERRAQIARNPPEPPLISKRFRHPFSLGETFDRAFEMSERDEDAPKVEAQVDHPLEALTIRREMTARVQGLLEVTRRFLIRRPSHRLGPRLLKVGEGLLPDGAMDGVVRQPIDPLRKTPVVQTLDRLDDATVEEATAVVKQALVRHIVRECMFESVLAIREELGLIEKLGGLQAAQGDLELIIGELRDRLEEWQGDVRADDRGGLEKGFRGGRQAIDASRENRLHGGGDIESVEGTAETIAAWLAREGVCLRQCPDGFLEEEGVSLGSHGQHRLQRCQRLVVTHQDVEQFLGTLGKERIDSELAVVPLRAPAVPVFGAIGDEKEETSSGETAHEGVQEHLCLRVDPLEILEDEEQRVGRAFSKYESFYSVEGALPALLRVEHLP